MENITLGINGFGRIGRTLYRLLEHEPSIRVALVNDLADAVWNRYDRVLINSLADDRDPGDPSQPDLFDFDDPVPF